MSLDNAIVLAVSGNLITLNREQTVAEIRDCLLLSDRVIAVVGASQAETQASLAQANLLPPHTDPAVLAWVMSSPQRRAASLLVEGLREVGISASVADTAQVGPTTRGPMLDAEPRTIKARPLAKTFEQVQVIVFPAGAARSEDLRPALVGSGHPLITASFIAATLALPARYLVADDEAARFDHAELLTSDAIWSMLPRLDQHAILFAQRRGVSFSIASPAARSLSRCGHTRSSSTADGDRQPLATPLQAWHALSEVKRDGRAHIARSTSSLPDAAQTFRFIKHEAPRVRSDGREAV